MNTTIQTPKAIVINGVTLSEAEIAVITAFYQRLWNTQKFPKIPATATILLEVIGYMQRPAAENPAREVTVVIDGVPLFDEDAVAFFESLNRIMVGDCRAAGVGFAVACALAERFFGANHPRVMVA